MKQERVQKTKAKAQREKEPLSEININNSAQALASDLDEILDEIDSVLEENAEEFVKAYVQKGGE